MKDKGLKIAEGLLKPESRYLTTYTFLVPDKAHDAILEFYIHDAHRGPQADPQGFVGLGAVVHNLVIPSLSEIEPGAAPIGKLTAELYISNPSLPQYAPGFAQYEAFPETLEQITGLGTYSSALDDPGGRVVTPARSW